VYWLPARRPWPRKRHDPLTRRSKVLLLGAMAVFGALPYAEEMLRCLT
jgi:hypothetical protein